MTVVVTLSVEGDPGDARAVLAALHSALGEIVAAGQTPTGAPKVVREPRTLQTQASAAAVRAVSPPAASGIAPPSAPPSTARIQEIIARTSPGGTRTPSPIVKDVRVGRAVTEAQALEHLLAELHTVGRRARVGALFADPRSTVLARRVATDDARFEYQGSGRGLPSPNTTIERVRDAAAADPDGADEEEVDDEDDMLDDEDLAE
ncbi:MAG: hypothetical protein AMXMBFR77_26610 [Phycisphaerales bacterium]